VATRRPLVVVSGEVKELPTADGLPGTKVSALSAASALTGSEVVPLVQGGATVGATMAQVNAYAEPIRQVIVSTQSLSANTDTYVASSALILPQSRMQAGVVARWHLVLTKTAAGTATPTINVRLGTAGTTSDAALTAFTGIAQTAVADTAWLEVMAVFRAHSSTATVYSSYRLDHKLAATGFATQSAVADGGVSGSVNTTTANVRIGLSINPGVSGVWTVQAGECQLENVL
jgi:hypothetical protein